MIHKGASVGWMAQGAAVQCQLLGLGVASTVTIIRKGGSLFI